MKQNKTNVSGAVPPSTPVVELVQVPSWRMVDREDRLLASYAMHSCDSLGRRYHEPLHPYRSPYERDRDRILHCSAFRRLSGKMQVFTGEMGEYHRTRLTHTFEVASVARTIGRVLRLNEDLIEGLALMHDIGHPPYGHCGEDVLDECLKAHGGFSHNRFALTIVEDLEERYGDFPGLNLSAEVLAGQQTRADKTSAAVTATAPLLEVQVVDAADSMAYDAHDVDDALQLGLLTLDELKSLAIVRRALEKVENRWPHLAPSRFRPALVHELIDLQVSDFVRTNQQALVSWQGHRASELCQENVRLGHSLAVAQERTELENFLFDRVYRHPRLIKVRQKAEERLRELYATLVRLPERLPMRFRMRSQSVSVPTAVGEYLAGMTDRFCDAQHHLLISSDGPLADW